MAELEWMLGFPPYLESMVKNLGSCFDKPNVYAFTFFNHKLFLILNWHCWASEKGLRQETQNIAGSNNWHDSTKIGSTMWKKCHKKSCREGLENIVHTLLWTILCSKELGQNCGNLDIHLL